MSRPLSYQVTVPKFILDDEPACAGTDPEIFYAEEAYNQDGTKLISAVYKYESQAKEICRSCPLISKCLAYAIDNYEMGIWGGTNERERTVLRSRLTRIGMSRTRSR